MSDIRIDVVVEWQNGNHVAAETEAGLVLTLFLLCVLELKSPGVAGRDGQSLGGFKHPCAGVSQLLQLWGLGELLTQVQQQWSLLIWES